MRLLLNILISASIALAVVVLFYLYFPLHILDGFQKQLFGSTITTINGSDTLSASRSVINTNFSNLNTDKLESGATANTLTVTNLNCPGVCTVKTIVATGTATSTYVGGIQTLDVMVNHIFATSTVGTSTISGKLSTVNTSVTGFLDAVSTAIQTISANASQSLSVIGQIGIDYTSDLLMYRSDDLVNHVVEDGIDGCFPVASTSVSHFKTAKPYGSATNATTTYAFDFIHKRTLSNFYCRSDNNSLLVQIGTGSATTTGNLYCSAGGAASSTIANNTFTSRQRIFFDIGSATSSVNTVTICPYLTITAD